MGWKIIFVDDRAFVLEGSTMNDVTYSFAHPLPETSYDLSVRKILLHA